MKNTLKIKQKVSKALKVFKTLSKSKHEEPTYIKFIQDKTVIRCETDGTPLAIYFEFLGTPSFEALSIDFKLYVNGNRAFIFNKTGKVFPENLLYINNNISITSLEMITRTGLRIQGEIVKNNLTNSISSSETKPEDATDIITDEVDTSIIQSRRPRQVGGFKMPGNVFFKGRFQKPERLDEDQIKSQPLKYTDKIKIVKKVIKKMKESQSTSIEKLIKKEEASFILNNKQKKASKGAY
tara:strand:- start:462 stop:1178 length:717 start_codon:yes stop_codon:yes gene_type:complete